MGFIPSRFVDVYMCLILSPFQGPSLFIITHGSWPGFIPVASELTPPISIPRKCGMPGAKSVTATERQTWIYLNQATPCFNHLYYCHIVLYQTRQRKKRQTKKVYCHIVLYRATQRKQTQSKKVCKLLATNDKILDSRWCFAISNLSLSHSKWIVIPLVLKMDQYNDNNDDI